MLKILFIGAGNWDMYEKAYHQAAKKIEGIEAELYEYEKNLSENILARAQRKLTFGPLICKANKALIKKCDQNSYDILFFYSARWIYSSTIKKLKKKGFYIALYNNDNPFSEKYPTYYWRHYRNSIKYADITYVYRHSNLEEVKRVGAIKADLMRSYYVADRNYYIPDEEIDFEVPEVVFIGHLEDDGRVKVLRKLLDSGIKLGLVKYEYEREEIAHHPNAVLLTDTHAKYNEILNKAKIAIVFLSRINKDTYTRRCFEIPVTKTLMISEYTEDLSSLFEPEKEALYFNSADELVQQIKDIQLNEEKRMAIANAAYGRVMRDGHEAVDRVQQIINDYYEMR